MTTPSEQEARDTRTRAREHYYSVAGSGRMHGAPPTERDRLHRAVEDYANAAEVFGRASREVEADARLAELETRLIGLAEVADDECALCPHPKQQHQADYRSTNSFGEPVHVGPFCRTCWDEHAVGGYTAHAFLSKTVAIIRAAMQSAPIAAPADTTEDT